MRPPRLTPNERDRRRHTIRAVVMEHTNHSSGWWLWKQSNPSIKVKIPNEDFCRIDDILRQESEGNAKLTKDEYEIGFKTVRERNEYPVNTEVELQLSTANPLDQFFTGAQPIRWDGIKKKEVSCAQCNHKESRSDVRFCAQCGHGLSVAAN